MAAAVEMLVVAVVLGAALVQAGEHLVQGTPGPLAPGAPSQPSAAPLSGVRRRRRGRLTTPAPTEKMELSPSTGVPPRLASLPLASPPATTAPSAKLPLMKPARDILKHGGKRKRVRLGSLYSNPHKKRRFKPRPILRDTNNATEEALRIDIFGQRPSRHPVLPATSTHHPILLEEAAPTTRHPIVPASFPVFHNISLPPVKEPKAMAGWVERPTSSPGGWGGRSRGGAASTPGPRHVSQERGDGRPLAAEPGPLPVPAASTTSRSIAASREVQSREVQGRSREVQGRSREVKGREVPERSGEVLGRSKEVQSREVMNKKEAGWSSWSRVEQSGESMEEVRKVQEKYVLKLKDKGEEVAQRSVLKSDGNDDQEIESIDDRKVIKTVITRNEKVASAGKANWSGKTSLEKFSSFEEEPRNSLEARNPGDLLYKNAYLVNSIEGLEDSQNNEVSSQKEWDDPTLKRWDSSKEMLYHSKESTKEQLLEAKKKENMETSNELVDSPQEGLDSTKEKYDYSKEWEPPHTWSSSAERRFDTVDYDDKDESTDMMSLGLGIEEVGEEVGYKSHYRLLPAAIEAAPLASSEDGLFHPESQVFPPDKALVLAVDFGRGFVGNSVEEEKAGEEESKVEVDLSHLEVEHRGEEEKLVPWHNPAFLRFGPPPHPPPPPYPPPRPAGIPPDYPTTTTLPPAYPDLLPLPEEPLPSASHREEVPPLPTPPEEVEGRSLPPPAPTQSPRTPKSAPHTVTRTSYTVTTPASYVFFEQMNVAPSPQLASPTFPKHRKPKPKTPQRKKSLQTKLKKPQRPRKKRPPKRQLAEEERAAQQAVERQIGQEELYFPNDESYFPSGPGGGQGSSPPQGSGYKPPNYNIVNHHVPSYTPATPSYTPSTPSYSPPVATYTPPPYPAFSPAPPSYTPPVPSYKPPTPSYKPPTPSYKPPTPSYTPSHVNSIGHRPHKPTYRPSFTNFSPLPPLPFTLPPLAFPRTPSPVPKRATAAPQPPRGPTLASQGSGGGPQLRPVGPVGRPVRGSVYQGTRGAPRRGIVDRLREEDLTVMAALLEETQLARSIDKQAEFTLFAPTDLAFNQFLQKLGGVRVGVSKLKKNPEELSSAAKTKLRSNIYEGEDGDWREVQVLTVNGARVVRRDLPAGGGLVHVVDRVLFPPTVGDLVETLQADPEERFTTFVKALQATRLDKEITDYNTGPWTVFAPTNTAFMNLPMKELEELITDPRKLSKLVLNHIINRTIFSAGLHSHQTIAMANGNKLNLFAREDRLKIEGSNVINMDIPATNGVIQVVESIVEMQANGR